MSDGADYRSWTTDDPAQVKALKAFRSEGSGQWTVLYQTTDHSPAAPDIVRYCVLSDPAHRAERMVDSQWDASIGESRPGFVTWWK
ncbi:MAG: hypothetical protein ACRDXC_05095, partial [Acidimicrobiales bacterium]